MITLNEVKTLLNISNTTYDTRINMLIPMCEDIIINYCNNHFLDKTFDFIMSTSFTFDGTTNKISLSNIGNMDIIEGDYIRIYNSLRNDNTYLIDEVSTDYIIVDSLRTIKTEDLSQNVCLGRVEYPSDLKLVISNLINFKLKLQKDGLVSESIDDYSYTLDTANLVNGIPKSITGLLTGYKSVYLKDFKAVYGNVI